VAVDVKNKTGIFSDILHHPNRALETARAGKRSAYYYWLVKLAVFLRILFPEYHHNHCTSRASGIAFVLLITLIPLISTVAFIFTGITDVSPEHVEEVLDQLLPFAPPTVMEYITEFFVSAQRLRGIGIGVLMIMALSLFSIMEQSLNSIWKVLRARTFFNRLRTFTMVVVYSPILFLLSHQLRNSGIFGVLPQDVFIMRIPPIIFTTLAFAVMFWFIPNTKVRPSSAIIGGIVSCALFELERWGFGHYVSFSIRTQTVYGTFGLMVFFLLSLYVTALLFLLGAQVAYVHQNFRPLLRSTQRWDRRVGDYRSYITMRMIIDCVRAFIQKTTPPTLSQFCEKYELTAQQAMGILNWLIHEKFIYQLSGTKQFVPARDFSGEAISTTFSAIEDQYHRVQTNPRDSTREYLASFMNAYSQRRCEDDMTFAELIEMLDGK
jgi:membrane protein